MCDIQGCKDDPTVELKHVGKNPIKLCQYCHASFIKGDALELDHTTGSFFRLSTFKQIYNAGGVCEEVHYICYESLHGDKDYHALGVLGIIPSQVTDTQPHFDNKPRQDAVSWEHSISGYDLLVRLQ